MILHGSEEMLHQQVTQYLRLQYRGTLFHSDYGSGARLTKGQAMKQKKLNDRAWPDITIAEPRGKYHGLYIELKKEGTKLYLKDGVTMVANAHYREQEAVLAGLQAKGYRAEFGIGFLETRIIIDKYLK